MRKLIIFLFVGLFLITLVNAQPPFEQGAANFVEGYEIEFAQIQVYEANMSTLFDVHVFNISNGLAITNETSDCFFHLHNSSGHFLIDQMPMVFEGAGREWSFEVGGGNLSELGEYSYLVVCNSTFFGGFVSVGFEVTTSGSMITEGNSSILNITIVFFMILSILLFINFMLVKDKPQVKWTSFLVGFIFLITALNIISLVLLDALVSPKITDFINSFVAISFILYWFAFGLLAVIWFLTILNTILFRRKLKQEELFNPA